MSGSSLLLLYSCIYVQTNVSLQKGFMYSFFAVYILWKANDDYR